MSLHRFGVAFGQRVVLAEVELQLSSSGVDVLMGPVKTGKSSLLRTLAGLYEGHAMHRTWGSASLGGEPLGPHNRPALVQQQLRLLDQTLLQVLRHAMPADGKRSAVEWREWAVALLAEHGLTDWVDHLDTTLMNCTPRMQRTALVLMQVATQPRLLMVDEPTTGLNESETHTMVKWLRELGSRCKLLVSLHNQRQARALATEVVLLAGGRVLAHQPVEAFFTRPANEFVRQFVQTGSLSLPSPDARPTDLETGTPLPPPLPPEALLATAAAPVTSASPAAAPQSTMFPPLVFPRMAGRVPAPELAPAPVAASPAPAFPPPVSVANVATAVPEVKPARASVALPLPMRKGVELASTVGKVFVSESRGPQGFRWVVPGMLAGTPQPGVVAPVDHDLTLLCHVGITHLITLTETDMDQAALLRHGLKNTHLSIFDRKAPSASQMHMLLVRMQRLMEAGEVLAVHCKAGLGRTGLVLATWLVRDGGLGAEAAIERLRKINPGYIQSDEQLEFLHHYEADILRRLI
ncbi:MAG: dual specificity protein phosphatase family protein [Hydrogenophaga sp.]|nr:dual specificity protein phosphatase family protein [Hydrogenophaga sp.]